MSLDLKHVERKFFPKEATPPKSATKRSPQKASDATSHTLSDHGEHSDAPAAAPEDAETDADEPQEPQEPEEPKTVKKRVG